MSRNSMSGPCSVTTTEKACGPRSSPADEPTVPAAEPIGQTVRTALNAVRGYAELMLAGGAGPLTADALDCLRQIARAGLLLERALPAARSDGAADAGTASIAQAPPATRTAPL